MKTRGTKLNNKTASSETSAYYDEISHGYDTLHGDEQLAKLRIIANELALPAGSKILDVGCGTGLSARVFEEQGIAVGIIGIEPSAELALKAKFDVICEKAEEALPKLPAGYFDAVICVTAIHHINPSKLDFCLNQMQRAAKKDALFAITVLKKSANFQSIVSSIEKLFKAEREIDNNQDLILICRRK